MRYVLAVIGFILGFILLIWLIVSFHPGSTTNTRTNTPSPKLADLSSTGTTVRFTTEGPIVAQENYREIRITISSSERKIEIITGYQGDVLANESFNNTQAAYTDFLAALDRAGFTLQQKTRYDTEAGLCPTSTRTIYELYNSPNDNAIKSFRRWSLGCSNDASFGGSAGTTASLFRVQIPNYSTFIATDPLVAAIGG